MKQVIQNYKTGDLKLEEVPIPALRPGGVLVKNAYSLISAGTERMRLELAQKSLFGKAKERPEELKQVIDSVKREGLVNTYRKVMNRLDMPTPLGYSSAGAVMEVGREVDEFQVGDRVACAGEGYACHAEVVFVPKNLCVKISRRISVEASELSDVSFEEAAFTTLGAIAIQGVRQADVRIGERVAVIGLGLVGLLTVQILKAAGCSVLGIDIDAQKAKLALELNADMAAVRSVDNVEQMVESFSSGYGVDAVVITAATSSNDPVELAGKILRDRGRVAVVGVSNMDIPRGDYYQKELGLHLSRSYGPGRYDHIYEERGIDYPIGYVRWTEKRNMQAFLELIATEKVDVKRMITHKFPITEADKAYDIIMGNTDEKFIGVLLEYPEQSAKLETKVILPKKRQISYESFERLVIGFIGAGNFAQSYLLPNVKRLQRSMLKGVCTSTGVSAKNAAQKLEFGFCTTDAKDILGDDEINTVFIATRHNSHAQYVIESLKAGKNVFVEKPLCITYDELDEIRKVYESSGARLMVGFNRRFSPYALRIKEFFKNCGEPFALNYRINAGKLPNDHWYQQPEQGGRIVGEGCHFIDFMQFVTGSEPIHVYAERIKDDNSGGANNDSVNITVKFADGSIGAMSYLANGAPSLPKERLEVFSDGKTAILDDFSMLELHEGRKMKKVKLGNVKGHEAEVKAFLECLTNGLPEPIPFESIYLTTLTTLKVHESIKSGNSILF